MSIKGGSSGSIVGGSSSISMKGEGSRYSSGNSSRIITVKGGSSSSGSKVISSGEKMVKIGKVVLTPKQGTDVWGTEDNLVKDVISGNTSGKFFISEKVF